MSFFTAPRAFAILALAATVLPVASHAAESANDTQVQLVSTKGLDLAQPADQAMLRHRIALAAHRVCEQVTQGESPATPAFGECFSRAMADAKAQMQNQIVSATTKSMVASVSR